MIDLQVIYLDSDNRIQFGFKNSKTIQRISSAGLLLQRIVLTLMTQIGSNKLTPDFGSQFLNCIGSSVSRDGTGVFQAIVTTSILQVENSIKLAQASQSYTTPRELLKEIEIESISNTGNEEWTVSLIVHTMSNEEFRINL